MNGEIKVDFVDMEKKLNLYVDRGRVTGVVEARKEPITVTKPDASLIKRARESSSTLEKIEQLREAEGKEAFGPYSAYRSVGAILFLEKERQQSAFSNFQPRL